MENQQQKTGVEKLKSDIAIILDLMSHVETAKERAGLSPIQSPMSRNTNREFYRYSLTKASVN
jgi:hypothetical protein